MIRLAHISIDDVTFALQRLSLNDYKSIYDDKLFRYLRVLNRFLGLKITLYVFRQYERWSLENVPDRYQPEFREAANWLKFSFHAISEKQKEDNLICDFEQEYASTITQIARFAGYKSVANIVRLHYWFYPKEYTYVLKTNNVNRLLVKPDYNQLMIDDIPTWKTNIRIEKDKNIISKLIKHDDSQPIVVFTHEWALNWRKKLKFTFIVIILRLVGYKYICE